MRIALATCADMPAGDGDDDVLVAALERRGASCAWVAWDDPTERWERHDAVLLRTTWDYPARAAAFSAWARSAAARTTLLNPPAIIDWNLRKTYLQSLAAAGQPTIPTQWLDASAAGDAGQLAAAAQELGPADEWFLKPVVAAGAMGTVRCDPTPEGWSRAADAAARWLAEQPASEGEPAFMVQPFLPSVGQRGEVSVLYLDRDGPPVGVRKVPRPGDYRVQDDHGATDAAWPVPASLAELADDARRHAADATGERPLYARVDYLDAAPPGTPEAEADWRLVELELIEPSLFFRHAPESADRLAAAVLADVGHAARSPI